MSTYTPAEQAQHLRDLCTALRSGEFKQGTESLHPTQNTYCCLGVGCELFRRATGEGRWSDASDDTKGSFFVLGTFLRDGGTWDGLPAVRDYYGMNEETRKLFDNLLALNDGVDEEKDPYTDQWIEATQAMTFTEIADWIERHIIPEIEAQADAETD